MTRSKKPASHRKKDPDPKWRTVRVRLSEQDLELLEKGARRGRWPRPAYAGMLLSNALRASWAYGYVRCDDRDLTSYRDYFIEISRLQGEVLEAANMAKGAAAEAALRYQQWIDAEKVRRDNRPAGLKVLGGKFGSAPKGAAS